MIDELIAEPFRLALPNTGIGPVFAVIAGRDRHAMTYDLLGMLDGVDTVLLFDNGSRPPYQTERAEVAVIRTPDRSLHAMWNAGLELAESYCRIRHIDRWNVAILNNDLRVPAGFLAKLAAGIAAHPDVAVAYPNWYRLHLAPHECAITTLLGPWDTRRSFSGWAFMLRGELGYRLDEGFAWWCGDDDLERQVAAAGHHVLAVPVACEHLEPGLSTAADPERRAMAEADTIRFWTKWGVPNAAQ